MLAKYLFFSLSLFSTKCIEERRQCPFSEYHFVVFLPHTEAYINTHIHTYPYEHTLVFTRVVLCTHTHPYLFIHQPTQTHTRQYTYPRLASHTHTCTYPLTPTRTHISTSTPKYAYKFTHTSYLFLIQYDFDIYREILTHSNYMNLQLISYF